MTAEEVRALEVGQTVRIEREGHEPIVCTVACRGDPANKFLTYRVKGALIRCEIRDYPGMHYRRGAKA